jgi:proteasome lid subunit RPN8/RPN11
LLLLPLGEFRKLREASRAAATRLEEVGGFILGRGDHLSLRFCDNAGPDPGRFQWAPGEDGRAASSARKAGWALRGLFHSHPVSMDPCLADHESAKGHECVAVYDAVGDLLRLWRKCATLEETLKSQVPFWVETGDRHFDALRGRRFGLESVVALHGKVVDFAEKVRRYPGAREDAWGWKRDSAFELDALLDHWFEHIRRNLEAGAAPYKALVVALHQSYLASSELLWTLADPGNKAAKRLR